MIQGDGQIVREHDLEGRALPRYIRFGEGREVAQEHKSDLMDVLSGDNSGRDLLALQNFFVFVKECTTHRLNMQIITSPEFIDYVSI